MPLTSDQLITQSIIIGFACHSLLYQKIHSHFFTFHVFKILFSIKHCQFLADSQGTISISDNSIIDMFTLYCILYFDTSLSSLPSILIYKVIRRNCRFKQTLPSLLSTSIYNMKSLRLRKSLPHMLAAWNVIRSESGNWGTTFWSNYIFQAANIWGKHFLSRKVFIMVNRLA